MGLKQGNLTSKQADILRFLRKRILGEGRPPTIREIGAEFGFRSTGTTRSHLKSIEKKGHIRLIPRRARACELATPALAIPILGKIAAGAPDIAVENTEGHLHLNEFLANENHPVFALRVKGESMKDRGIFDGDLAIVRKQDEADDGAIVAALIEDEATVKILKKEGRQIYLLPANVAYPEIRKPFRILGRVTAVIKKF